MSPNRCSARLIPRGPRRVCRYSLSVSGDDVCGFVCIVSSPSPPEALRVRAQVYHGDEDGVAHIMLRERKTRAGVYHRNKGTADSGTYYAAKSNYEAAISRVEFYGLFRSLSLSLHISVFLCPLPPFSVPLGARPHLRWLTNIHRARLRSTCVHRSHARASAYTRARDS